ncbi:MAG TPA: tetratricopeptide repeat protein [Blastocatellia bacterium]|nr:tetratricopeptide repeat protein [Blastocatellia bacterium]
MRSSTSRLIQLIAIGIIALGFNGCGGWWKSEATQEPAAPPAVEMPSDTEAVESAIRFLEDRVKRDPDDIIALNKLAGYYLQRQRETGNVTYLELAGRAARQSLAAVPAEFNNKGALSALAQVEFASHEFAAARDHAAQLVELDPDKSYPYGILGDALLELGDYDKGAEAFAKMQQIGGSSPSIESRLARLALLRGQTDLAAHRMKIALALAANLQPPQRETVAWCRWQLGEIAFSSGNYEAAEQYYRDSLVTFPDYYRALGSLGKVLAARGDTAGAIAQYERATKIIPDPMFVAALGDLYKLAGREQDAAAQYALVEQIGKLSAANGVLYNRQLALFYADHDIKPDEAYNLAAKEYAARQDIYTADAVAWTALKAGKLEEAQSAIKEALRLGTQDAKLFYHAGMIAQAAGDKRSAKDYLARATKLNPQFDPLQAMSMKSALDSNAE